MSGPFDISPSLNNQPGMVVESGVEFEHLKQEELEKLLKEDTFLEKISSKSKSEEIAKEFNKKYQNKDGKHYKKKDLLSIWNKYSEKIQEVNGGKGTPAAQKALAEFTQKVTKNQDTVYDIESAVKDKEFKDEFIKSAESHGLKITPSKSNPYDSFKEKVQEEIKKTKGKETKTEITNKVILLKLEEIKDPEQRLKILSELEKDKDFSSDLKTSSLKSLIEIEKGKAEKATKARIAIGESSHRSQLLEVKINSLPAKIRRAKARLPNAKKDLNKAKTKLEELKGKGKGSLTEAQQKISDAEGKLFENKRQVITGVFEKENPGKSNLSQIKQARRDAESNADYKSKTYKEITEAKTLEHGLRNHLDKQLKGKSPEYKLAYIQEFLRDGGSSRPGINNFAEYATDNSARTNAVESVLAEYQLKIDGVDGDSIKLKSAIPGPDSSITEIKGQSSKEVFERLTDGKGVLKKEYENNESAKAYLNNYKEIKDLKVEAETKRIKLELAQRKEVNASTDLRELEAEIKTLEKEQKMLPDKLAKLKKDNKEMNARYKDGDFDGVIKLAARSKAFLNKGRAGLGELTAREYTERLAANRKLADERYRSDPAYRAHWNIGVQEARDRAYAFSKENLIGKSPKEAGILLTEKLASLPSHVRKQFLAGALEDRSGNGETTWYNPISWVADGIVGNDFADEIDENGSYITAFNHEIAKGGFIVASGANRDGLIVLGKGTEFIPKNESTGFYQDLTQLLETNEMNPASLNPSIKEDFIAFKKAEARAAAQAQANSQAMLALAGKLQQTTNGILSGVGNMYAARGYQGGGAGASYVGAGPNYAVSGSFSTAPALQSTPRSSNLSSNFRSTEANLSAIRADVRNRVLKKAPEAEKTEETDEKGEVVASAKASSSTTNGTTVNAKG